MEKSRFSKSLVILAQLVVLILAAAAQADVCYYVTDNSPVRGLGINDNAQIVGYVGDNTGLWQNGSVTDLGALPGYNYTGAEGISDSGRYVSGYAFNVEPPDGRGVLWTDGAMTELPPLPGDVGCAAVKVNNSGIAVGFSSPSGIYGNGEDLRPVYWENGVAHALPTLGGAHGDALNINNAGQIVGESQRADGSWTTTLWVNGTPFDLGDYPGFDGHWSRAISDSGLVAVNLRRWSAPPYERKTALWDNGVWTVCDNLQERPKNFVYAVNDLREIVGFAYVEYIPDQGLYTDQHAILCRDGVTYDLNSLIPADSGWELNFARDINDRGQIVARGYYNGVHWASCLLTPVPIITPELSGGATAEVVYDRYGNVGGYAAGLPAGSELVGGTTDLENFELTGQFATLTLQYDEDDLLYENIIEWTLRLYWYDDLLSQWVLAGNNSNLTWNPAAQFVLGAPTDVLGDWGLDMVDNYVWANIDHASTYSMGGQPNVPAPGAVVLGILGVGVIAATRRFRSMK